MKKSIKIILIIIAIILLFIFGLIIFYFLSKNNSSKKEDEKLTYQIQYLDFKIIKCIESLENSETNKNEIQKRIQEIYEYWNTMILDLSLNKDVSKDEINTIGQDINKVLIAVNDMKKIDIEKSLIELYGELVKLYENSKYNKEYKMILITKYNLIYANLLVEKNEWINAENFVKSASEAMTEIFNLSENSYNINLAYISVKELESIMKLQNYNLFLIKYKIAMENLNKI